MDPPIDETGDAYPCKRARVAEIDEETSEVHSCGSGTCFQNTFQAPTGDSNNGADNSNGNVLDEAGEEIPVKIVNFGDSGFETEEERNVSNNAAARSGDNLHRPWESVPVCRSLHTALDDMSHGISPGVSHGVSHDPVSQPMDVGPDLLATCQDTGAVAEASYISSVEKRRYGNCGRSNSSTPKKDFHINMSSLVPDNALSDSGYIDFFSNVNFPSHTDKPVQTSSSSVLSDSSSSQSHYDEGQGQSHSDLANLISYHPKRQKNCPFVLETSEIQTLYQDQHHINRLPSSLLLHTFGYLSPRMLLCKVGTVCKYWYNLCRDPDLWRFITLRNQDRLTDLILEQLVSFSDRVLYLDLTDCRSVTSAGVRTVLTKCRYLQTLKLMRCFEITDEAFMGLGIHKPQLRRLHLDGCYKIRNDTVRELAEGCADLELLHLNQCLRVTDDGIITLARNCHKLKQLLLDHCDKVTDKSLTELVANCPHLEYVNFMACGVTDDGVIELAKLTELRNLDLSNIPRLTPRSVTAVARSCHKLECINISLNSIMDDSCVEQIAKHCRQLKRLYCVSCSITDRGVESIGRYQASLESLDLGWCQDITDNGVKMIAQACRRLTYLGLIRCDQVTAEGIEDLVVQYPHINFSTFILESRRLLERARREGFQFGLPASART